MVVSVFACFVFVLIVVYCVDSFCGIVYYVVVGLVCCVGLVGFCLVVCVLGFSWFFFIEVFSLLQGLLGCVVLWVIVIDVLVVSVFIGLVCDVVCCFTVIVVLWVCFGLLFGCCLFDGLVGCCLGLIVYGWVCC